MFPHRHQTRLLPFIVAATIIASAILCAQAYTWPNPLLDELESQIYDREGYHVRGLPIGLTPCNRFFFGANKGRTNAADWLRTAYHDMATHNIRDGSGGLDASIRFFEEQQRPEASDGFRNTLTVITQFSNRYYSLSDNIALAAVTSIEMCGGPKIPFRGGRLDAAAPNKPGVPEPQGSLKAHIDSFARQGFTQEEMIGLVACGHTLGGVQHSTFPEIAPPSTAPDNTDGNARFDSQFDQFDNKVVTEYLSGKTQNVLVVGKNQTTNSDLRIFSSDRNRTMQSLASPKAFRTTCSKLIAKMIDTVPKGVKLAETVDFLRVKPYALELTYMDDGSLQLTGEVRFWDMPINPRRKISILWRDRGGKSARQYISTLTFNRTHVSKPLVPDLPGIQNLWYTIEPIKLDAKKSISEFWFEIDEGRGKPRVENQNGKGFFISDDVVVANSTCLSPDAFDFPVTVAVSSFPSNSKPPSTESNDFHTDPV
ncbi:heme peroxidase [Cristinia sonorae]|uniref:Peroxidase n=1 Tax=Cristinia sonorae TaxID=1940300 RepID=A0A8K0XR16_9AGAR|nr:heme peroxidase [Cristinia sonorae]